MTSFERDPEHHTFETISGRVKLADAYKVMTGTKKSVFDQQHWGQSGQQAVSATEVGTPNWALDRDVQGYWLRVVPLVARFDARMGL